MTESPQTILVETADRVCTITLNRPKVYNALNPQMASELGAALDAVAWDDDVRVVVLTGAGRAFNSGQDLAELKDGYAAGEPADLREMILGMYNPLITQIRALEKPVIAAVNGVAAGAGCSLALACDYRIASTEASFLEAFVNIGLVPDLGSTWLLPREVGYSRALEICCSGRRVEANEALQLGIFDEVVPADELMNHVQAMAATFVAQPGRAITLIKQLLQDAAGHTLEQQLTAEADAQSIAQATADHVEGVRAFIEKRRPEFTGE